MSATTVAFGGMTFSDEWVADPDGIAWVLVDINGWGGAADVTATRVPRPLGHGEFAVRAWRGGAIIPVQVWADCPSRASAAATKTAFASALADGEFSDLTVDDPDEGVLTASVRLAAPPVIDWNGGKGVGAAYQLYAADPLRYGPWSSASTGFPTATGGLVYPLYPAGVLDYGTPSDAGRVTMSNIGTAPSYPQFTIVGPVDAAGFEILEVGPNNRLRFETTVPAGSSLLIDPALGAVLIDGVADRARYLTRQTIGAIAAGESVEYAFYPLGPTSTAQMTAAMRPAYW